MSQVIEDMGMVIEGINTCKAAYELAQEKNIEMPIVEAIYNVLYKDANVSQESACLMHREGKAEGN